MATLLSGGGARTTGEPLFDLPPGDAVEIAVTEAALEGGPDRLRLPPYAPRASASAARATRIPGSCGTTSARCWPRPGSPPAPSPPSRRSTSSSTSPPMNALAARLDRPLRAFTAAELARIDVPNPSEVVRAEVGTPSVAEAAALAATGGRLVRPKRKTAATTAALARAADPIVAHRGRPRGRVSIVSHRSRPVRLAHARGEPDDRGGRRAGRLRPLHRPARPARGGQAARGFPAGRRGGALPTRAGAGGAGTGRRAGLLGRRGHLRHGRARVRAPGRRHPHRRRPPAWRSSPPRASARSRPPPPAPARRSATTSARSRCRTCSRRATTSCARIRAAAEGDFVIAFYNPVSKRRRTLLAEARDTPAAPPPRRRAGPAGDLARPARGEHPRCAGWTRWRWTRWTC